jgi:hypothetical protein
MALYQGSKLLAMGANGKSAYEHALAGGFTGSQADFERLLATAQTQLDNKAALEHSHEISDVNGLQAELNGKSNLGHTHVIDEVTGLQTALDSKSDVGHEHEMDNVKGLLDALNGKAALVHTHTPAEAGAENSKNFVSKFGRAKSYGTQTIGTPDAGAVSMKYFFVGLAKK